MRRWQRGEVTTGRLIAGGELQTMTGAAADGAPWLAKARRTLATAAGAAGTDPDSAFTLAYDAARFACVALLVQQGLRSTTRGGHYAVEVAIRDQSGDTFDRFGSLRRQRNDIEYAVTAGAPLTASDAHAAITLATEFADAAEQLLPHLGMFSGSPRLGAQVLVGQVVPVALDPAPRHQSTLLAARTAPPSRHAGRPVLTPVITRVSARTMSAPTAS